MSEDEEWHVRVFSDYWAETPVWFGGGLVEDLEDDLGVSRPLADRLRSLAALFNDHVDWRHGWSSEGRRIEYNHLLEQLAAELQSELGAPYWVTTQPQEP